MNMTEAQSHLDKLVELTREVPKLKGAPTRPTVLAGQDREWRIATDEFARLRSQLAHEARRQSEADLAVVESLVEKLKAADAVLNSGNAERILSFVQATKQNRARAMAEAAKDARLRADREKAMADVIAWLTA